MDPLPLERLGIVALCSFGAFRTTGSLSFGATKKSGPPPSKVTSKIGPQTSTSTWSLYMKENTSYYLRPSHILFISLIVSLVKKSVNFPFKPIDLLGQILIIIAKTTQPPTQPPHPNHPGNKFSRPKSNMIFIKLSGLFHDHQPR